MEEESTGRPLEGVTAVRPRTSQPQLPDRLTSSLSQEAKIIVYSSALEDNSAYKLQYHSLAENLFFVCGEPSYHRHDRDVPSGKTA